ncbi:DNA adenine methylase [Mariniphaga sp.]|uniref:DNA adenine methylase n=1 Tax=Mariniphaga sp. TaxID=1954475 RepID=UPI003562D05A
MTNQKNNIKKSEKEIPAKPFLKWAGGKGQLLEAFQKFYPKELSEGKIETFCEPFVGGGAVFFNIVQKHPVKSALLCDNNEDLILTYLVIQKEVQTLIEQLNVLQNQYLNLNEEKRTEYYYKVRDQFNTKKKKINYNRFSAKWMERAAQIIFLNRTCFNGLFRFNSKGGFNVPQGKYKNPKILDAENLVKVSQLLSVAEIQKADFREIKNRVNENTFVYYDPPYRPLNQTSSFTAYSKNSFGDPEQIALATLFSELNQKGIKQMLSNSDPKNHNADDHFFDELYKEFQIFRVPARRAINSAAHKRHAINEIVVTNYHV